jgi:hypothetical protein
MPSSTSPLQAFFDALAGFFRWLFGPSPAPSAPPPVAPGHTLPPDSTTEPTTPLTPRVLLVVFDPVLEPATGRRLLQAPETARWSKVDDLVAGYIGEVESCSAGLVKYTVVERLTRDTFPKKADGHTYTPDEYLQAVRTGHYYAPDLADYAALVNDLNLLPRLAQGDFDEVWFFGGPGFGFYESHMGGPGAFWCNSPALTGTEAAGRRFAIMGFSYERGVGEMLEDLGHRAESVLRYRWRATPDDQNLWLRYARYEAVAPGQAEVGLLHWAPNSRRDYDWGNPAPVVTRCDTWLNFPDLSGPAQTLTCAAWGGGDIRLHHRWWLAHLPKVPGRTRGVANNWWRYVINLADEELDS